MEMPVDGALTLMNYSYGAPEIKDIYDLGVPRTARIVDARQEHGASASRPAVFELSPTTQLVKDDSIDPKVLDERLYSSTLRSNFWASTGLAWRPVHQGRGV